MNIRDARAIWGGDWVFFVDLSRWNVADNYLELSKSIDAAIIKLTGVDSKTNVLFKDGRADTHIKGLRGLKPIGAYHYAKFVSDDHRVNAPSAREQARYFAERVNAGAFTGGFTVAALDLEPGEIQAAYWAGWTRAQLEQWVRDFMRELSAALTSTRPVVYLSGRCIEVADGALDWLRTGPYLLWWAGYITPPFAWPLSGPVAPLNFVSGWPDSWAWQYAGGDKPETPKVDEGGKAPGVSGDVDCNITKRNSPFARALLGQKINPIVAVLFFGCVFWGGLKLWRRK
jgi:GH25 family lysozyme M1 (1,4-beta-N-acetylmuramidase)